MEAKKKLLESIKATFEKEVIQPYTHKEDDHIAIHNQSLSIIGYFNIRCTEELIKMLKKPTP